MLMFVHSHSKDVVMTVPARPAPVDGLILLANKQPQTRRTPALLP